MGRPRGNPRQILRLLLTPSFPKASEAINTNYFLLILDSSSSYPGCFAFVLRKSMQTGKEPVKVTLRLAFARP